MFEFSIDVEKELSKLLGSYEIIIPSSVKEELENLSNQGQGAKVNNSKAALKLISRYSIYPTKIRPVDDSIISIAQELKAIVVTNDKLLRLHLKDKNVRVIYLRGKKILEME
jgi:rRNA-processing protein FCF1